MAFGDRYRQREAEEKKTEEKPPEKKPVLKVVEEKTFTSGDGLDEEEFIPVEEPKIKIVRKNRPRKPKAKEIKVVKEFPIIDPASVKEKDGVETKKYVNIALNGTTVECNDFRAIVKKKGLKITEVLTKVIKKWNDENYNL